MEKRTVTTRGLLVSGLIGILVIIWGVFGIGVKATPEKDNHYIIDLTDYKFNPSNMTWRVGETVTLTIRNQSQSTPGKPHEFMLGKNPNTRKTVFGEAFTDGYEIPFFKDVDVKVLDGKRMMMIMAGKANWSGLDPKKTLVPDGTFMKMSENLMVVFAPPGKDKAGGSLTIQIKVPDKPGEWQMGCFQESAQHLTNGMIGTVTIID